VLGCSNFEGLKMMAEVGGRALLLLCDRIGASCLCNAKQKGNTQITKLLEEAYQKVGLSTHEVAAFKNLQSETLSKEEQNIDCLKTRQ